MAENTQNETIEIDLEKVRDQKCIPLARTIIKELATDMIPADADPEFKYNDIAMKILSLFLAEDLNVQTDTTYVPQLILGVLAGLNKAAHDATVIAPDDVRFNGIARKILAIVAEADLRMGAVTPEETAADFAPVKEQLDTLFAEEKITTLELAYIMDNIFDSFTAVNNMVARSLENSTAVAEAKLFKITDMSDLTTKRLDEVLKTPIE